MPEDVIALIMPTRFEFGKDKEHVFYCECPKGQNFKAGHLFDMNLIFKGMHFNYTFGNVASNKHENQKLETQGTEYSGTVASKPAAGIHAPLASLENENFSTMKSKFTEFVNNRRQNAANTTTKKNFVEAKRIPQNKNYDEHVERVTPEAPASPQIPFSRK